MRTVEKLLPTAIDKVRDMVLDKNMVPKEFNGYISSLGASIIMSGLLPTLVFYSQEGKSKGNRRSVIDAIEAILNEEYPRLLSSNRNLLKTALVIKNETAQLENLQNKIQEAAIALKLAIRIFPKSDK